MSIQKKAETLMQLGYSNKEIVRALKIPNDRVKVMRYRFNNRVKDGRQTQAVTMPEVASALSDLDTNIKASVPVLKQDELEELKFAVQRNLLLAHSSVSYEVARRAKSQQMSDEALAVVHKTQLDLFKD